MKGEIRVDRETEAECFRERGVRLGGGTGAPMSPQLEEGQDQGLGPDSQTGPLH